MHLPNSEQIEALSRRIIWFEPPQVALKNLPRFIAYAMRYGSFRDMDLIRSYISDEELRDALRNAPPGIIDSRSWAYWHLKLDMYPPPEQRMREFMDGN